MPKLQEKCLQLYCDAKNNRLSDQMLASKYGLNVNRAKYLKCLGKVYAETLSDNLIKKHNTVC